MVTILRLLASAVTLAVCLWPLWLYLWVKSVLVPVGFWQNAAMLVGGFYVLGGLQVMFAILWFAVLWFIWVTSR
ncbi:MAG: hypothetical protein HYT14_00170 [Candidatus Liptonbacteria bacterium]|nr:hypothetical protein [Candidatus Liptonbacteria bacterium]